MQLTKDTGMRLPQRWASSYNRVACLYIIPTKILSISMTVAMLGKFYQYKDNKGTNWPLYGKHASYAQSNSLIHSRSATTAQNNPNIIIVTIMSIYVPTRYNILGFEVPYATKVSTPHANNLIFHCNSSNCWYYITLCLSEETLSRRSRV